MQATHKLVLPAASWASSRTRCRHTEGTIWLPILAARPGRARSRPDTVLEQSSVESSTSPCIDTEGTFARRLLSGNGSLRDFSRLAQCNSALGVPGEDDAEAEENRGGLRSPIAPGLCARLKTGINPHRRHRVVVVPWGAVAIIAGGRYGCLRPPSSLFRRLRLRPSASSRLRRRCASTSGSPTYGNTIFGGATPPSRRTLSPTALPEVMRETPGQRAFLGAHSFSGSTTHTQCQA